LTDAPPARPPALVAGRTAAIVFDLDGTLVDSYTAIAESLNHARAAYELPPLCAAEVRRRVGHGLEALVAELVGPDRVDAAVALFRGRYAAVYASATHALPHAATVLPALVERGYRLAVASNKPSRFSRPILERLGLLQWFTAVIGPEEAGSHKPDPAMLGVCRRHLRAAALQTLYVGDMVLDVETARRAEVPVVLVRGGSSLDAELAGTGETVIDSLADLPPLLGPASRAAPDPVV
jgi:phosphoglycolate phosphatase